MDSELFKVFISLSLSTEFSFQLLNTSPSAVLSIHRPCMLQQHATKYE